LQYGKKQENPKSFEKSNKIAHSQQS
jgi:hypothetical protein